jgi:GntR family transcriptional repressor for pyruvate dehydrogenase complex
MKSRKGHISNDPDIEPLRTQEKGDVTHLLIGRFQELLSNGLVMPGARLPSERELAKNFGVARSSLRQALKVLEIMGVITQKVGDGSYLNKDASRVLSVPMEFLFLLDGISLDELAEMRLVIEPEHAARAAQRANSDDIALLRQSIVDVEASRGNSDLIVSADLFFHQAIFQASGSRLSGRLFDMIHREMLKLITMSSQPVDIAHILDFHKPIFNAIQKRDAALAAQLMTDHLKYGRDLLLRTQRDLASRRLRDHFIANQPKGGEIRSRSSNRSSSAKNSSVSLQSDLRRGARSVGTTDRFGPTRKP